MISQGKKHKKKKILILLLLLLIPIVVISAGNVKDFIGKHQTALVKPTGKTSIIDVDANGVEKGSIDSDDNSNSSKIQPVRHIVYSPPVFDSAKSKGRWRLINHKDNKDLSLQVIVKDKQTDSIMYISPLIKSDEKVEKDYLTDQTLEAGTYEAIATFNYYTKDESLYFTISSGMLITIKH